MVDEQDMPPSPAPAMAVAGECDCDSMEARPEGSPGPIPQASERAVTKAFRRRYIRRFELLGIIAWLLGLGFWSLLPFDPLNWYIPGFFYAILVVAPVGSDIEMWPWPMTRIFLPVFFFFFLWWVLFAGFDMASPDLWACLILLPGTVVIAFYLLLRHRDLSGVLLYIAAGFAAGLVFDLIALVVVNLPVEPYGTSARYEPPLLWAMLFLWQMFTAAALGWMDSRLS